MKTSDQYATEAAKLLSDGQDLIPAAQGYALINVAQVHAQLAVAAAIRETAADVIATLRGRS